MTITNKAFREAMEKAGLGSVQLEKDNGYFWIWSDDAEMSDRILSLKSDTILVNSFKDCSIAEWVDEIKSLLGFRLEDLIADLHRANCRLINWNIRIEEKNTFYYDSYHPGFILKTSGNTFTEEEDLYRYLGALELGRDLLNELNDKYKNLRVLING